jgi:hypothetical protein
MPKFRVHIFASVSVQVDGVEAATPQLAAAKAFDDTDLLEAIADEDYQPCLHDDDTGFEVVEILGDDLDGAQTAVDMEEMRNADDAAANPERATSPNALPTIKVLGRTWFIDRRLNELRNVNKPSESEPLPAHIVFFPTKADEQCGYCGKDLPSGTTITKLAAYHEEGVCCDEKCLADYLTHLETEGSRIPVMIPESLQKLIDAGGVEQPTQQLDGSLEFAINGLGGGETWWELCILDADSAYIEENSRGLGPVNKWSGKADEAAEWIESQKE